MTNVYLYGELRNKFGYEFQFSIDSAKEALLAINANRKGFLDEIKRLAAKNIFYRIVIDDSVVENPKELEVTSAPKEIHIVPVIWGAGKNGMAIGMIVVGLALAAVSGGLGAGLAIKAFTTGALKGAAFFVSSLGLGIAMQGVMSLLFPPPKPDFNQEVQAGGKSYLFGAKPSNTSQGQAIPVGYGRLMIGSSQISSSTTHYPLAQDIKSLMTPVDKPINDYTRLEYRDLSDSSDGLLLESFSTNQAATNLNEISFASALITNSYIDIITKSATKASSPPVEVIVKRDGKIVSNPNLPDYDEDIEYEWQRGDRGSTTNPISIQNLNAFESGIAYRSYHFADYNHLSRIAGIDNRDRSYFTAYSATKVVKYGPSQFTNLPKPVWDYSYNYNTGELVSYPTGNETETYFQAVQSGINNSPTGSNLQIRSTHWRKILRPQSESLYTALVDNTGVLPDIGNGGFAPYWQKITQASSKTDIDILLITANTVRSEGVYIGELKEANENNIVFSTNNSDNYAMEFMGYFDVPVVENLKKAVPDSINGVMYEILKIGDTGQWAAIGLTGQNGSGIAPRVGSTFVRNAIISTGDGIVYPVVKYNFKIDSDDAADLFIDGTLASSFYGDHGFSGVNKSPEDLAKSSVLPSTSGEILLTAGHHQLYTRFQDNKGGDGISVYYQYDTNWDGAYSDFKLIEKERLKHKKESQLGLGEDDRYIFKALNVNTSELVAGKQYKIRTLGTTNWGEIGASSPRVGTVFVKNSTPAVGNGTAFEDFYNYTETKSANKNRTIRFTAERKKVNGRYDMGYSIAEAKFNCKVTLDGVTLTTSPVKVQMKFDPSSVNSTQGASASERIYTD